MDWTVDSSRVTSPINQQAYIKSCNTLYQNTCTKCQILHLKVGFHTLYVLLVASVVLQRNKTLLNRHLSPNMYMRIKISSFFEKMLQDQILRKINMNILILTCHVCKDRSYMFELSIDINSAFHFLCYKQTRSCNTLNNKSS